MDEELYERLRQWRARTAAAAGRAGVRGLHRCHADRAGGAAGRVAGRAGRASPGSGRASSSLYGEAVLALVAGARRSMPRSPGGTPAESSTVRAAVWQRLVNSFALAVAGASASPDNGSDTLAVGAHYARSGHEARRGGEDMESITRWAATVPPALRRWRSRPLALRRRRVPAPMPAGALASSLSGRRLACACHRGHLGTAVEIRIEFGTTDTIGQTAPRRGRRAFASMRDRTASAPRTQLIQVSKVKGGRCPRDPTSRQAGLADLDPAHLEAAEPVTGIRGLCVYPIDSQDHE